MEKVREWIIHNEDAKRYRNGYPLVTKDVISSGITGTREGDIVHLVDETGRFIAKAYYGEQNKGIGWVLSTYEQTKIDGAFFRVAIENAINLRTNFYGSEETNAFRVFNGEGDGIGGFTIDYFDGFYLINWYSAGIYTYKKQVIQTLEQVTEFRGIYEKRRFKQDGKYIEGDDFVTGEKGDFPLLIKENDMHYMIDLNDGAMSGLFLDQREVRKAVRDTYAQGKRVLNTFSYTGAFSVAASLGGATQTTSVDLAKRSLPMTIRQFSANGIDYEAEKIHVMDVFEYFKYARRKKLLFDTIILDPPSFARTKKYTFSVAKDYTRLLTDAIALTANDGIIVASTNNAALSMKKFKVMLAKGFEEMNQTYKIVEEYTLPEDFRVQRTFPYGDYLKVVILRVNKFNG